MQPHSAIHEEANPSWAMLVYFELAKGLTLPCAAQYSTGPSSYHRQPVNYMTTILLSKLLLLL